MFIRVLKNYGCPDGSGIAGETREVSDEFGARLVEQGKAEPVEKKISDPKPTPEIETAEAKPEAETAEAKPKVKKRKSKKG